MRRITGAIRASALWLLLLLAADVFFIFLIWLAAPAALPELAAIILLFSVFLLLLGLWRGEKRRQRTETAIRALLAEPDQVNEQALMTVTSRQWQPVIVEAAGLLREQRRQLRQERADSEGYREFIEEWTHEIKTPLSLAALVLSNHREEMSPYVKKRLEHVQNAVSGDVERVLYYARLHAAHRDYQLERTELRGLACEVLENIRAQAEERSVRLEAELPELTAVTDKKVLSFILSQLLSNAVKYAKNPDGLVLVRGKSDDGAVRLTVWNNGPPVPSEDLPFIFDKGFTGSHPDRQSATGMGLYFVKKYADALAVTVEISENSQQGFGISLVFPEV